MKKVALLSACSLLALGIASLTPTAGTSSIKKVALLSACSLLALGIASLTPTPRVVPRPGQLLWEFRKDHVTYSCELRYHGEWGVEAQILRDGDLCMRWRFNTRALAVQWAEGERRDIEAGRYDDAVLDDIAF